MNKIMTKNGEYIDKEGNPVYTGLCFDGNIYLKTPDLIYYDGKTVSFKISKKDYKSYKGKSAVSFKLIRPEGDKDRYIILNAQVDSYKSNIFSRAGTLFFEVIEILSDEYLEV